MGGEDSNSARVVQGFRLLAVAHPFPSPSCWKGVAEGTDRRVPGGELNCHLYCGHTTSVKLRNGGTENGSEIEKCPTTLRPATFMCDRLIFALTARGEGGAGLGGAGGLGRSGWEGGLGLGGGGGGAGGAAASATCTAEMPYVEGKVVPSCPMGSRCSADKDKTRPETAAGVTTEATASTMMEPGRGLPGRIWT